MSLHDVRLTLLDMLEYGEQAIGFLEGRGQGDLDSDVQLRFALIRALEIFGEAASRLPATFRAENREIPWRSIIATRNRLAHAYDRVDNTVVWNAAALEVPEVLNLLRIALAGLEEPADDIAR